MSIFYLSIPMIFIYFLSFYFFNKKFKEGSVFPHLISIFSIAMVVPAVVLSGVDVYTPGGNRLEGYGVLRAYIIGAIFYVAFFFLPGFIAGRKNNK